MEFEQVIRQIGRGLRAGASGAANWARGAVRAVAERASDMGEAANRAAGEPGRWSRLWHLRGAWQGVAIFILVLAIVYPLAAWRASIIDDDVSFGPPENSLVPAQSRAVAAAASLLDREVNRHGWVPNDPFFWPTALLDNMPNFQRGIQAALARFSFELTGQIGRTRGSSQADADLQAAAGFLQYPPDMWVWNPSVSIWPTATSEQQYNAAIRALNRYNARLGVGAAIFDRRADNLLATLDRIKVDLGSASASIDNHIRTKAGFFINNKTDDVFYIVKGQMYGYYIVLKGLQQDFADVIRSRDLTKSWQQMMDSLREGIELRPWIIVNGRPDSQFAPCHLCAEGFYLLRARTQMHEIVDILAK